MKRQSPVERLRAICLALPGTSEKLSHGEPTFWAGSRMFVTFANGDSHHGAGRDGVWCAAPDGAQRVLVDADSDRFFVPPYVGPRGWIGVWLDRSPDWNLVASVIEDAYRTIAPKRALAAFEAKSR
jgi:hypothetical protein